MAVSSAIKAGTDLCGPTVTEIAATTTLPRAIPACSCPSSSGNQPVEINVLFFVA